MDAMIVVQSERELQLSDDKLGPFLGRLKALQVARRRVDVARNRSLMELRRLVQPGNAPRDGAARGPEPDDSQLRARLKAIDEAEAQGAADIRQARLALEQLLTPRQQARFRLLEDQVERRKLDLVARSRRPIPPQ
jgi:Spy/CpxP family protein refolding chaperone